ncbi:hypothetical protein BDM02DRAFT_3110800 [Thelephora ganbajun]|uniref:Uncharacterized protein n=1 Tax=Thelephora ganbajun TaxID=370292 RepID=A0ACB6ZP03_THEGA|nr:hypothetical protein BDM02DRAFT_3110800 [Thelephora ganbajun]
MDRHLPSAALLLLSLDPLRVQPRQTDPPLASRCTAVRSFLSALVTDTIYLGTIKRFLEAPIGTSEQVPHLNQDITERSKYFWE